VTDRKTVIRTRDLPAEAGLRVRHPFNPNSELNFIPLSRMAGMRRCHLSMGRLPPGKEGFPAHDHARQEEFISILDGAGRLKLGEEEIDLGPGDYVGFPTDGTAHKLLNNGQKELVYLMGGEASDIEVCRFPDAGKLMVVTGDTVRLFDEVAAETFTLEEWIARTRRPNDGDK
jgi:uncharacterized cupin superfamily protein